MQMKLHDHPCTEAAPQDHFIIEAKPAAGKNRDHWAKKLPLPKIYLVIAFLVFIALAAAVYQQANNPSNEFLAFLKSHQAITWSISFLFMFIFSITLIPTLPFTLFVTALISPQDALLITTLANSLAALAHYFLGKGIGDIADFEDRKKKLPFKLGQMPIQSPIFLLAGRAVPGGQKSLSFICGAYHVPLFSYIWTTLLANLCGAALVVYSSNELFKML